MIAAAMWGVTGIFVRILNAAGLDNIQLLFIRSIITAAAMSLYLLATDKSKLKVNPKDLWYFFGTGILSFLLFGFCYFYTISHASMSVAAILLYTSPFFVMIMAAIFFGEKITPKRVFALIMAVGGCFLICGTDSNAYLTPKTLLIGICSGFCYALYSIFGRVALKKYDSSTVTAYTFIFAAAGSIFAADFRQIGTVAAENPGAIALAVFFAFISAVLPYIFYTNGLKYTDAGKASVIATLEAAVASLAGTLVFGETIGISGIIGIILVFSAIAVLNRKSSR